MAEVGSRVHALFHATPNNNINYTSMAYSFPAGSSQSQSHGGNSSSPSSAATTTTAATTTATTANNPTAAQLLDDVDLTSQSALDFSDYLMFDHPEFAVPPQPSTTTASAAFGGLEEVAMATPAAHDPVHDQFQFQSGSFNPSPPANLAINTEIVAG